MAVVKANYVKRGNGAKARAKASIRYIQHRRDKDGQRITRQLFGSDGPMDRDEAYRMIDEAKKGSVFYRIVVSPDPQQEDMMRDLDMRDLTEQTMRAVEERVGEPVLWVAALHADHAPHRHIHVLAVLPKRLQVQDLAAIRAEATQASLEQRQELDLARQQGREQAIRIPMAAEPDRDRGSQSEDRGGEAMLQGAPAPPIGHTCPRCGPGQTMKQVAENVHWCPACKFVQKQEFTLQLQGEEAAWER